MRIKRPTIDEIDAIADGFGLNMEFEDIESFKNLMEGPMSSYERIDDLVEPSPEVKYPRGKAFRPEQKDNLLNAWYYKASIQGASRGKLKGKTIAVKDNIHRFIVITLSSCCNG